MFVFMGGGKLHLFSAKTTIFAKLDGVDNIKYNLENGFKSLAL